MVEPTLPLPAAVRVAFRAMGVPVFEAETFAVSVATTSVPEVFIVASIVAFLSLPTTAEPESCPDKLTVRSGVNPPRVTTTVSPSAAAVLLREIVGLKLIAGAGDFAVRELVVILPVFSSAVFPAAPLFAGLTMPASWLKKIWTAFPSIICWVEASTPPPASVAGTVNVTV
jgi:hypothetical protein